MYFIEFCFWKAERDIHAARIVKDYILKIPRRVYSIIIIDFT